MEELRSRQQRNLLATLLLSIGTPMLLGGDEFGRSQDGNNNAYCQDNEISWYDYGLVETNQGLVRFARGLVKLRLAHPAFRRPEFFTGKDANYNAMPDIVWYDERGLSPDWARIERHIAWRIDGSRADIAADRDDNDFLVLCNAGLDARRFVVHPAPRGKLWALVLNTGKPSPHDLADPGQEEILVPQGALLLPGKSMALLMTTAS